VGYIETYGYFTPCFAGSLIGKMGTHPLQSLDVGDAIIKLHGAKTALRARLDQQAFRLVGTK